MAQKQSQSPVAIITGIISILLVLLVGQHYLVDPSETKIVGDFNLQDIEAVIVERVVDGDTIIVTGDRRVRLIQINAPESVHADDSKNTEAGKIVSDYVKDLIEGEKVYLEKDVSEVDQYDRLLRYVFLEDGTFLNLHLVEIGFAYQVSYPPDVKYESLIIAAENKAQEAGLGLWAD